MLTIDRVLETSLYVSDLQRSRSFYEGLFGFKTLLIDAPLCTLGVPGRQVLLLFLQGASEQPNPVPGGTVPPHGGTGRLHLAFAIPAAELDAWRQRLADASIDLKSTVCARAAERASTSATPTGTS